MKYRKTSKFFKCTGHLAAKTQKAILLLFVILLQTACNKYPKRGESLNQGGIVSNFETEYQTAYAAIVKTSIIKNVAEFDSVLKDQICVNTSKNFDFNSFSINGQTISFNCNAKIIREVKINHNNKLYTYTINFKDVGMCIRHGMTPNLVIVPKISDDYKVEFKVHEDVSPITKI
jgi:hypothetical protein